MNDLYLNFQDAYIDSLGEMYVSSNVCNGLFSIGEGGNRYIGSFLHKPMEIQYLHKAVYLDKNDLLFVPSYGNEIDLFSILYKKIDVISPKYKINDLTTTNIILDGKIFFIPRTLGLDLCTFDTESRRYERHSWWGRLTSEIVKKYAEASFFYATVHNGNIFLPLRGYNIILEVDFKNKEIIHHNINISGCMPYSIDFYNDVAWITQENSRTVIRWEFETNNIITYKDELNSLEENFIPYIKAMFIGSKILFIPRNHPLLLMIDLESEYASSMYINKENIKINNDMNSTVWFYGGKVIDNQLMLFPSNTDRILVLNPSNGKITWRNTGCISKKELLIQHLNKENSFSVNESKVIELRDWIECIVETKVKS